MIFNDVPPTKTLEKLNAHKNYIFLDGRVSNNTGAASGMWLRNGGNVVTDACTENVERLLEDQLREQSE